MRLISLVTTFRNNIKCIIRNHPDVKYIICENSIYTIKGVLKDLLQKRNYISALESQILDELCDDPTLEWLNPTRIIYLNTRPEICMDRIRNRIEESKSSIEDNTESYEHITLPDLTQYKESLKNILNLADTTEIDGNHSDLETRRSWVTQISHLLPQL
jgi:deoxyadenosine/deoxycytidine kinase